MIKAVFVSALVLCLLFWAGASKLILAQERSLPQPLQNMNEEGIDVMWNLLPEEIVKANFGKKVRERFYGVEIVVGNNTGKVILIESLAFNLRGSGQMSVISLQIIFPLVNKQQAIRLCASAFAGNLLVQDNRQVRTVAFVPRTLVGAGKGNTSTNGLGIRDRLGQLIVVGRELVEARSIRIPAQ